MGVFIEPTQIGKSPKEKKPLQNKPKVNWPRTSKKAKREDFNADVSCILESLKGTVEQKLESMGDIIYGHGAERYGIREKKTQCTS